MSSLRKKRKSPRSKRKDFVRYSARGGNTEMPIWLIHKGCMDKTRFHSRKTARAAARDKGLRYYRCDFCGSWHLTKNRKAMGSWE